MDATYVSVWDGGTQIRTNCKFNPETRQVSDVESSDVEGLDICEEEFIELPNGDVVKDFINEDGNEYKNGQLEE